MDNGGNDNAIFFDNYGLGYIFYRGRRVDLRGGNAPISSRGLVRVFRELVRDNTGGVGLIGPARCTLHVTSILSG